MNGAWKQDELAMLLGYQQMGESIEVIAMTVGRSELEVQNGLRQANALLGLQTDADLDDCEPASNAPVPTPGEIKQPKSVFVRRQWRTSPMFQTLPKIPRDVTALLMGDPEPHRSALHK